MSTQRRVEDNDFQALEDEKLLEMFEASANCEEWVTSASQERYHQEVVRLCREEILRRMKR